MIHMKDIGTDRLYASFENQKEAFGEAIWYAQRQMIQDGVYLTFDDLPRWMIVYRILVDRSTVVVSSYFGDEPPASEVSWDSHKNEWVTTADHGMARKP